MRFLRRNQFLLLTVAVTIASAVLVLLQFRANESRHVRQVEDFIFRYERGDREAASHLYQVLVQQLPGLPEHALSQDLARTALVVDPHSQPLDDLVWKYQVSLRNELRHRAETRFSRQQESSEKP